VGGSRRNGTAAFGLNIRSVCEIIKLSLPPLGDRSVIESEIMAPPNVKLVAPRTKFDRERLAFARLRPQLLSSYRGQYVAIHDEKVVGSGSDLREVAFEAYAKFGYIPIYVDLVTDETPRPVRIRGPREIRKG
jgi:hypothetical protein